MKPYSDNIIFFDTEFSSLDPQKGEILSIGLVKAAGEELYLELDYKGEFNEWAKVHLVPFLTAPKLSHHDACQKIRDFIGEDKPFLMSYVIEYDAAYLYKLFGVTDDPKNGNKDLPFHWITIDFASLLFAQGIDPTAFTLKKRMDFLRDLGIDPSQFRDHHALDDAKILKAAYMAFLAKS